MYFAAILVLFAISLVLFVIGIARHDYEMSGFWLFVLVVLTILAIGVQVVGSIDTAIHNQTSTQDTSTP